ncbi:hypothetical protein AVEN_174519-1 [Araneus ventricosus]|uniref:Uncharacterized protein n=1 Tax=Araneus ventricosus TaxID=182803 RepID=A0A4Y2SYU4_ARAVE|nr:hypothetical protein AVEN_174519-1 [Araneus ventricosus]
MVNGMELYTKLLPLQRGRRYGTCIQNHRPGKHGQTCRNCIAQTYCPAGGERRMELPCKFMCSAAWSTCELYSKLSALAAFSTYELYENPSTLVARGQRMELATKLSPPCSMSTYGTCIYKTTVFAAVNVWTGYKPMCSCSVITVMRGQRMEPCAKPFALQHGQRMELYTKLTTLQRGQRMELYATICPCSVLTVWNCMSIYLAAWSTYGTAYKTICPCSMVNV